MERVRNVVEYIWLAGVEKGKRNENNEEIETDKR